ncbi:hypothetical protein DFH06DRAFT_603172 [Mycena polygramma]|nr:hypothetical protein DFH06DRAFT_603172 [Mycena polygramma]
MFAKSAIVSVALFAAAAPVLSAPLPGQAIEARELEARLSLPAGAIGDLIKSLGKGLLSGGAVAGLAGLLGASSDDSSDSSAPASRELDARGGLASILGKLVGAGEESLESVIKNAVIGGAASGVAVEGVNAAAGQSGSRRSVAGTVVDDAAKAAEKGLGSVIGNGVADGVGTAAGGLGIGAIISKLFGSSSSSSKRALEDLSDDEVNTLLEYVNTLQGGSNTPSARALGSVGKGVVGLGAGLAATQAVEAGIEKIESLFRREISLNDLD